MIKEKSNNTERERERERERKIVFYSWHTPSFLYDLDLSKFDGGANFGWLNG